MIDRIHVGVQAMGRVQHNITPKSNAVESLCHDDLIKSHQQTRLTRFVAVANNTTEGTHRLYKDQEMEDR